MELLIKTKELIFNDLIHYPDIEIEKNTVTFISGPSGCGKSTLFKLLNASLAPSSGEIFFKNQEIYTQDIIELRRKILLAKQSPFLFRGSVQENMDIFHQYAQSSSPQESKTKELLDLCAIDASPKDVCDTMSGGERQRVFLAIALSLNPEVLLLDEPTSALNGQLAHELMSKLIAHCKKSEISLSIISHDNSIQSAFGEKIITLSR